MDSLLYLPYLWSLHIFVNVKVDFLIFTSVAVNIRERGGGRLISSSTCSLKYKQWKHITTILKAIEPSGSRHASRTVFPSKIPTTWQQPDWHTVKMLPLLLAVIPTVMVEQSEILLFSYIYLFLLVSAWFQVSECSMYYYYPHSFLAITKKAFKPEVDNLCMVQCIALLQTLVESVYCKMWH